MAREEQVQWWHKPADYEREGITPGRVVNAYAVLQNLFADNARVPDSGMTGVSALRREVDGMLSIMRLSDNTLQVPEASERLTAATVGDTLAVLDYLRAHGTQAPFAVGKPLTTFVDRRTLTHVDSYLTEQYVTLAKEERTAEIMALMEQHSQLSGLSKLRHLGRDPYDTSYVVLEGSAKSSPPVIRRRNYDSVIVQSGRSCVIQGNVQDLLVNKGGSAIVLGTVGKLSHFGGKTEVVGRLIKPTEISGTNITVIGDLDNLPPTQLDYGSNIRRPNFFESDAITILGRVDGGPLQRKPMRGRGTREGRR